MKIERFLLLCFTFFNILFYSFSSHAEAILNASFASSASCVLLNQQTISLAAVFPEMPACDDNMLYLYELSPYMYGIPQSAIPIAEISMSTTPEFSFPLYDQNGSTRLYHKFAIGIKSNASTIMITNPQYITNPELLATNTRPRKNRPLKSVQGQNFWNVEISKHDFFENSITTIQLMNSNPDGLYTNPLARTDKKASDPHPASNTFYYMPNASDEEGIQALAQSCRQYALDQNVENYILGNEVNVRQWNYMSWVDWHDYIREYVQAFRVTYNAIKSVNANAYVFTCIDLAWDRNKPYGHKEYFEYMDAKDFLIEFNDLIMQEGNIDWSLAQHPYPVPLTCSLFWNNSIGRDVPYCHEQVSANRIVTFENLSVLTDFMQTPAMLSPTGSVRHLILSEIGLTNAQGIDVQAAALCASYVAAEQNPFVEEIIYLLADCGPSIDTKLSGKSLDMFQNMDGLLASEYRDWAKKFIGITDWAQVLR